MFAETVTLSLPDWPLWAWIVLGVVTWYTLAAVVIRNLPDAAVRFVEECLDMPMVLFWLGHPVIVPLVTLVVLGVAFEQYVLRPKSRRDR